MGSGRVAVGGYLVGKFKNRDFKELRTINQGVAEKLSNNKRVRYTVLDPCMQPSIRVGSDVILKACRFQDLVEGDIVFCKIKKQYFILFVLNLDPVQKRARVGDAFGKVWGWTPEIFGRVVKYLELQLLAEDH